MASSFPSPNPIETKSGNIAGSYRRWIRSFTIFHEASGYSDLTSRRQAKIVLQCAGPDIIEAAEHFVYGESKDNHVHVLAKIEQYCTPKKTEIVDRYVFWTTSFSDFNNDIDSFVLQLHKIAAECHFGDQRNNLIRDKIVFSIANDSLRRSLFREKDLSLEKTVDICKTHQLTNSQLAAMSPSSPDTTQIYWDAFGTWLAIYLNWMLAGLESFKIMQHSSSTWDKILRYLWHMAGHISQLNVSRTGESFKNMQRSSSTLNKILRYLWHMAGHISQLNVSRTGEFQEHATFIFNLRQNIGIPLAHGWPYISIEC